MRQSRTTPGLPLSPGPFVPEREEDGVRVLRIDSFDGQPGGGQTYVRSVTRGLAGRGIEQRFLEIVDTPDPVADPGRISLIVPPQGIGRAARDLADHPVVARAIREQLAEFRPDLIHLHHFDAAFTTLARELSRAGVPVIFTAHDAELVCPISTLILPDGRICEGGVRTRCLFTGCRVGFGGPYNLWQSELFTRRLAPQVRAYLAPSRPTTRYLDAHGFRPAIHLPSFIEVPPEIQSQPFEPPTGPFTVGFLGRFEPYKGIPDLLSAFPRVLHGNPDARLLLAGEGPERPGLIALAERLGIGGRTEFLGRVSGPEREAFFRRIHVLAFPSNVYENFGLVALEALVRGRPVVGTNVGGIPDIVEDRRTGLLVPIRSPDSLARALLEVAEHPDLGRSWAEEGRRRVLERYLPPRHLDQLIRVYSRILEGAPIESMSSAADL